MLHQAWSKRMRKTRKMKRTMSRSLCIQKLRVKWTWSVIYECVALSFLALIVMTYWLSFWSPVHTLPSSGLFFDILLGYGICNLFADATSAVFSSPTTARHKYIALSSASSRRWPMQISPLPLSSLWGHQNWFFALHVLVALSLYAHNTIQAKNDVTYFYIYNTFIVRA